ncbi:MAG: hypothetical protein HYR60_19675 [Acidobacteria bacterium]|nr:hypothetical protein [Acidobacteriota bacterium]
MNKREAFFLIPAAAAALLWAQDSPADRVTVPFSDPARPGVVKAHLIHGGITVKGYDGKEVIVEARARSGGKPAAAATAGMKRVAFTSTGLTVEEENNVMSVGSSSHARPIDLTIQVPRKTSLKLNCINEGAIQVEDVDGEIEVNNINGAVTLANVSGSAVAHALNGKLQASFRRVDSKPMSFSSLNGDIDVTFPPDLKAIVKMKSDRGEVLTDFDLQVKADAKPVVEDARGKGGKYRVQVDRAISGTINGGGPEIQFKNFNGAIYIRKGK